MGRIYKKEIQIDFNECDFSARAKLSTVLKHLADIAGSDYTDRGLTHKYLWDKKIVFLLSKFSINFVKSIYDSNKIITETYERMIKGAFFYRDYVIKNDSGEPMIYAKSTWVVCEPTTRRLIRPTSIEVKLSPENLNIPCDEPTKLKKSDNLTKVGERKIVYSDIDNNLHLYNAKYADIICDFLPIELLKKNVKTFKVNFEKEALYSETLDIFTDIKDDVVQSVGMKGNELSYIAELTFTE